MSVLLQIDLRRPSFAWLGLKGTDSTESFIKLHLCMHKQRSPIPAYEAALYQVLASGDMLDTLESIAKRIDETSRSPSFTAQEHDEILALISRAKGKTK